MKNIGIWLRASRPRTLMLSFSGIMTGGFLACAADSCNIPVIALCALTAMLLQVLSNFANDYGDFHSGVDGADRIGPTREMQSGKVSERAMLRCIAITALLTLLSGAVLVFVVARLTWQECVVFAALGLAAVLAAVCYTMGKHPYGYRGLGDLSCFMFFGLAAVAGTYYLAVRQLDFAVLLPASALGFLSNAVLNINNMRDVESDRKNGKTSLVVRIGLKKAYLYHVALIAGAFVALTVFVMLQGKGFAAYAFWMMAPWFVFDLIGIRKTTDLALLDPFLKKQVIKTFLTALLFGLGMVV